MKFSLTWAIGGAAIATVTSRFVYTGSLLIYSHKKLKVKTPFSRIFKPFLASIVMAGAILAANSLLSDVNLIIGFIEVISGIVIYFFVLDLFKGIDKKEIGHLLKNVKPSKLFQKE